MRTPFDTPAQRTRERHLRRRAQRLEAELARALDALARERAAIAAEREALAAYLNSDQHQHDTLTAMQAELQAALRDINTRYRSCGSCGGYSRQALDALLEPALEARREALGLAPPAPNRHGPWPTRPGAVHHHGQSLKTWFSEEDLARWRREVLAHG